MFVPKFETDLERFEWLLIELRRLSGGKLEVNPQSAEEVELYIAAFGLFRIALDYASGIHKLITSDGVVATGPIQRALHETWIELKYMLEVGDPVRNALKLKISTLFELNDFANENSAKMKQSSVSMMQAQLDDYEKRHPLEYEQVALQRSQRKYHWSGISISRMEKTVFQHPTYKYLSWEAHATLASVRDVKLTKTGDTYLLQHSAAEYWPFNNPDHVAYSVSGTLFYIWCLLAQRFNLPTIEVPMTEEVDTAG